MLSLRRLLAASIIGVPAVLLASAAAADGPKAFVGDFKDNAVSVVDLASGKTVATIPVARGPHGMAISPKGDRVYVAGEAGRAVSVINAATNQVERTIEVGETPNGLAVSPDGLLLFVAVWGEDKVVALDTRNFQQAFSIAVPKPHTVALSPDGQRAYVTSQQPGHPEIVILDLATGSVGKRIGLDKPPRDGEVSYDGRKFYFTLLGDGAVEVLDTATNQISGKIQAGPSPHFVNLFGASPYGLVVVQGPGELRLFDPDYDRVVQAIPVGSQPHWATVTHDGSTALVTVEGSDSLALVDLKSQAVRQVPVGHAPRKVVVQ